MPDSLSGAADLSEGAPPLPPSAGQPGAAGDAARPGRRDDPPQPTGSRPRPPGVLAQLQDQWRALWRDLPGLLSDRVELLTLELQRAGRALAQIVALLVAAAILGVTAWLALWAGIAVGLVELGLHWALALGLVLLLNGAVAALALARLRLLLPLLRLPATRRHLTLSPVAAAGADARPAASATSTTPAPSTPPATPPASARP
jgi:hypothetical protein